MCVFVCVSGIEFGASVSLTMLKEVLCETVKKLPSYKTEVFQAVLEQLHWFAGQQIRNVAVCHLAIARSSVGLFMMPALTLRFSFWA